MITKKDLQDSIDEAISDIISAVTKGFETVATKVELQEVKEELGGKIDRLTKRVDNIESELKSELKDVKRQINDLKVDLPTQQEFSAHDKRFDKLETAVFPS